MRIDTGTGTVGINIPTRDLLWQAVTDRLARGDGFALATVNLDHLVKLRHDRAFARAYAGQDFVVADGRPIVWLSRLSRQPVALMPGSDLILPLARIAAKEDWPIALLGSTDAALAGAAEALVAKVPGLRVLHCFAPPMGFDPEGDAAATALQAIEASGARLCFLALGAPKQEILALRGRALAPSVGFVSIGAGLDFLSGHQRRAPKLMRALALEWLWRALSSPKRLVPRYLACFAILPGLILQAWRQRHAR